MTARNLHETNRRIFAGMDGSAPFFQLYCRLVALELALKDLNANNYDLVHDVCQMAVKTFPNSSSVAAAVATLNGDLASLACSNRRGQFMNVRAASYPDMRYLRMALDFEPPATTDAEIAQALRSLDSLVDELRQEGLPWP